MARLPRLSIAGQVHHVIHRGNNSQPVFVDDVDRQSFLDALREASALHGVLVHAYVLMDNHVHLLVTHGIHIIENLNLEELAAAGHREFGFVGIPLKFRGATGSPIRPLALIDG